MARNANEGFNEQNSVFSTSHVIITSYVSHFGFKGQKAKLRALAMAPPDLNTLTT
jgi:hypothetical protein